MFGYVLPAKDKLSDEDLARFQSLYCGLCHTMGQEYGFFSRFFLNYDFTFLAMLLSSLYEPKEEVAAARCRDINEDVTVYPIVGTYDAQHREDFFTAQYDYIVDCIDLVSCKLDLIEQAKERGIPILTALGTGNKRDASQFTVTDIAKTYGCPLARVMRKELRGRDIHHLKVVFSPEEPAETVQTEAPPPGRRSVPGSVSWVPAAAGLLMAQTVVEDLLAEGGDET